MTLTSLFGGGHIARNPSSLADNVEKYYNLDRGDIKGHGWTGAKSEMKKTKSTLSALTLLAFLFFLNLLLTCLKDTVQSSNPDIIVMPQQRVTRGVLSGQLMGAVGVQSDGEEAEEKVATTGSIWSRIIHSYHQRRKTNESRGARGGDRVRAGLEEKIPNEVDEDGRSRVDKLRTKLWPCYEENSSSRGGREDGGARGGDSDDGVRAGLEDKIPNKEEDGRSRVDKLRAKFWPCCAENTRRRRMIQDELDLLGEGFETSLEKPDVLRVTTEETYKDTAGGHLGNNTTLYKMEGFPRWGPLRWEDEPEVVFLDVEGDEPEGVGHETRVGGWKKKKKAKEGNMLGEVSEAEEDEEEGESNGRIDMENELEGDPWKGKTSGNIFDFDGRESMEDSRAEEDEEDEDDDPEEDEEHSLLAATLRTPWEVLTDLLRDLTRRFSGKSEQDTRESLWEIIQVFLDGLGRSVAGKGWEESLESLDVPGSQFFQIRDHLMVYAMPIVRDTSTRLGLARCKELIVCETSRLSEFFADEEVTSIFHSVFKWMYGMKEPELRSIAKDGETQNNCKHFVRRCKTETENRSWLPMVANLLDFFIT